MGTVEYSTTTQTVISKSYDTQSTSAKFRSITSNPVSSNIFLEIAASSDNFINDDSGWLAANQIDQLNQKKHRYIKFKITLTNSNPTTPTLVDEIFVNFDSIPEEYNFKGGCGLIKTLPPQNESSFIMLLFLLLGPCFLLFQLKNIKTKN